MVSAEPRRGRPTAQSIAEQVDLGGRRALVTGASAGLGAEVARVLALRGARVAMGTRNEARTRAALDAFGADFPPEARQRCAHFPYDGDDLAAVRGAADAVPANEPFDLVVLNAGTFGQPFRLTPEGHEATMAANYLGHVVLLHRLSSARRLAAGARIVATLSESVVMNPFARADLEAVRAPSSSRHSQSLSSGHSKVLLSLLLVEMARRAQGTYLAPARLVGALPPATLTNNIHTGGALSRLVGPLVGRLFFRSVGEGAAVLLSALVREDLPTGVSFLSANLAPRGVPAKATDPAMAVTAWAAAEEVLELPTWAVDGTP